MKRMKITFSIEEVKNMIEERVKAYGYESIENIHDIVVDISSEGVKKNEINVYITGIE